MNCLDNPFGINFSKYIIIKYVLSTFVFVVSFIKNSNFILSFILFIIIFFLPNIFIYYFTKNENLKIIGEISNLTGSLVLSISSGMSIKDAFKIGSSTLKKSRFKTNYQKFVDDYLMYNLNLNKAIEPFSKKFNSYEFNTFLFVISDLDSQNSMLERLEIFNNTLESVYFKYLKYKAGINFLIVSLGTVISLINIFILVGYPMAIQISSGFSKLFL